MKKATKAVLLSALVFPGTGQLYLKRWVSGALLFGIAAYALYFIVSVAVDAAVEIVGKIESGAVAADVETVTQLVTQQLSGSEQATNIASIALGICWLLGVVGGYLQGRVQDERDQLAARREGSSLPPGA